MFQSQLYLISQEKNGLCHLNIFVLIMYVKYQFNSQSTISFTINYLNLIFKKIVAYINIYKKVDEIVIKSFSDHFWYLSR